MSKHIERRDFLKLFGAGVAGVTAALTGCRPKTVAGPIKDDYSQLQEARGDRMTYRKNPTTGDKVSLLGYGMMRLPNREDGEIDQEAVNRLVDYALAHGVY